MARGRGKRYVGMTSAWAAKIPRQVCDRTPPMDLASDRQLIRELEILKEICATPSTSLTNDTWRTSTKPLTAETSRNERYLALTKRPSTSECPNERWARQTPTRWERLLATSFQSCSERSRVFVRLDNTNSFREMNIFSLVLGCISSRIVVTLGVHDKQSDLADELCQAEGIARNRIAFYDLDSRKVREMRDVRRYQAIYLTFAVLPPTKKAFSPSRSSQDVAMSILQQVSSLFLLTQHAHSRCFQGSNKGWSPTSPAASEQHH
eukprot:612613-Hanusia_phi.AAC.6